MAKSKTAYTPGKRDAINRLYFDLGWKFAFSTAEGLRAPGIGTWTEPQLQEFIDLMFKEPGKYVIESPLEMQKQVRRLRLDGVLVRLNDDKPGPAHGSRGGHSRLREDTVHVSKEPVSSAGACSFCNWDGARVVHVLKGGGLVVKLCSCCWDYMKGWKP